MVGTSRTGGRFPRRFPPTAELENYVINFLMVQKEKRGAIRNYAKYCLRTLEGMLEAGASGFAPSVDEIAAYTERPPILATISLVDHVVLTEDLPVTPDLNCGKVAEICAQFLELTDERAATFGIFVYDLPRDEGVDDPDGHKPYADLERTPKPCQDKDFMGDVIVLKARQKRHFKFVYKRKIFLPQQNGPSDDAMFNRLVYLQAEDEVINEGKIFPESEPDALELAAISLYAAMVDDFSGCAGDLDAMEDPALLDFVPPKFREAIDGVAGKLVALRTPLGVADAEGDEDAQQALIEDLQQKFVKTCANYPLYGASFFHCHRVVAKDEPPIVAELPGDVSVAFGHGGMYILDSETYDVLHHFGYADVCRWGGSSSIFSLFIWNLADETTFELKLSTSQAADMAGIILDYINAIMAATGDDG